MAVRSIEPYRDRILPERFHRWIEILRNRIKTIPCFFQGLGSPEGVITANQGDLYYDETGQTWYVKTTDGGNTGWITSGGAGGGNFAGLGIWRYRTAVTATPASGRMQFDDTDIDAATEMYVNVTNDAGTDMSAFLALVASGDLFYVQVQSDATQFVVVQVGTPVLAAGVYTFPITNVEAQGSAPSNNTQVAMVVSLGVAGAGAGSSLSFDATTAQGNVDSTPTNLIINVPASVVDGNLMLLHVSVNEDTAVNLLPLAGWTEIVALTNSEFAGIDRRSMVGFREANSEPATYTLTYANINPRNMVAIMTVWDGVSASVFNVTPVVAHTSDTQNNNTPDTVPITTVSPNVPLLQHLYLSSDPTVRFVPPNGYAIVATIARIALVYKIAAAAGPTFGEVWPTDAADTSSETLTSVLALEPL